MLTEGPAFALSIDAPIRTTAPSASLTCLPAPTPAQRGQILSRRPLVSRAMTDA